MQKKWRFFKTALIFSLTLFIVFISFSTTIFAQETTSKPILFSEVNFLGSSYSSNDEWVELYNPNETNILLDGYVLRINNDNEIRLSGEITSKSFFLITKLASDDTNSNLNIKSDLVSSTLNLRNTNLNLKLVRNDIVFDEVNFSGTYSPKNKSNGRSSFVRETFDITSEKFNLWLPSQISQNLKQSRKTAAICAVDYATPKNINFQNEIIYEVENLCPSTGQIVSEGNNTLLKISNFDGSLFNFDLELDNKAYIFQLYGRGDSAENFKVGSLNIDSNQGKFNYKNINSNYLNRKGFIEIKFKNKSKKPASIEFETSITDLQTIYLDKIIIKERANDINLRSIEFFEDDIDYDVNASRVENGDQSVIKFEKLSNLKKETKLIENLFVLDGVVKTNSIPFMTTLRVKAENFENNIDELEPIISVNISNPNSEKGKSKVFRKLDFENDYVNLWLSSIPEKEGVEVLSLTVFGNADIFLHSIKYAEIGRSSQNIFDEISIVDGIPGKNYSKITKEYVDYETSSKGEIFSLKKSNYCQLSSSCNLELNVERLDSQENEGKIFSIFWGHQGNQKETEIQHIYPKDLSNNKIKLLYSNRDSNSPLNKLVIYSYGNSKLRIHKPKFTNESQTKHTTKSSKNINWSEKLIIKSSQSFGFKGQLMDILTTERLEEGKYTLSLNIKKLEEYKSGKDIFKIKVFDEKGSKVGELIIDENDLDYNKEIKKSTDIVIKKSTKIYLHIYSYGNHLGAQADIEVRDLNLSKL